MSNENAKGSTYKKEREGNADNTQLAVVAV